MPRVWKKGDGITIDFPMEIRCVKGRKRQSGLLVDDELFGKTRRYH